MTMDETVGELDLELNRDNFMRTLIRELSGALQDIVGLDETAGFVSLVGQSMGQTINERYRRALGTRRLTREQVTQVLVDLKHRIEGDFYVIEQDESRIVLGNRACPFGDKVRDRPSLCMMTSNVFGSIVADNLGYAKVELQETIARGSSGCRIVVHLDPSRSDVAPDAREYFRPDDMHSST